MLQDVPDNELIVQPEKEPDESKQEGSEMEKSLPFHWIGSSGQSRLQSEFSFICNLGKGGFGEVFKVKNNLDSQIYAIKRIKLDQKNKQLTRKLRREVELLSRLNHENVVRYYNSWIEVTPAEDLDLDSDETDEESSFAYQAHDKSLSLRFLKIIYLDHENDFF